MSMKPGATTQPVASSSRRPWSSGPISRITPSAIATSATRPGPPAPSTTVPPRMTVSGAISTLLPGRLRVDHELEQVAVGITHVDARRVGAATALPRHRALLDRGADGGEPLVERVRRAVPHEADVAAGWYRGGCPQREPLPPPDLGAVEVDHLVADVHGDDRRVLGDVEAEAAVERDHRVCVAHRQRHVVEAGDPARRFRRHPRTRRAA